MRFPLAVALLCLCIPAQEPWSSDVPVHLDRILVKLAEDSGAVLHDGALASRSGADLSAVATVFGAGQAERLIRLPLATLDRWHRAANAAARPGERIDHLGHWFRLSGRDAPHTRELLGRLRGIAAVEEAYLEPWPHLPDGGGDIPPTTPDYSGQQDYRSAPPNGIHSAPARTIVGGRGKGVQVTDMEVYWNIPHEDACKLSDPNVWAGAPSTGSGDHGTAVVGEMTSDRNGYGTSGICDEIGLKISSWNDGGVANAIANGINVSQLGDIVLLEVHYNISGIGWMPAEYITANYDVIRTATAMGIHVVEAAGNGGVDLDGSQFNGRFIPGHPNFLDSGAVMAGATEGVSLVAAGFSNRGARITANGWGRNVTTLAYGGLFNGGGDQRQEYTSTFSGTSSASPIVVGAVAQVVGAVEYQDERDLTIDEVRQLLLTFGTPCTGKIQNRPDVVAMLASLGLPDGLDVRSEQVAPGGSFDIELSGPAGGRAALLTSTGLSKFALGLNRSWHLDAVSMFQIAVVDLPAGARTVTINVPNLTALKDTVHRFQAVSVDAGLTTLHVSSSGEVWVF